MTHTAAFGSTCAPDPLSPHYVHADTFPVKYHDKTMHAHTITHAVAWMRAEAERDYDAASVLALAADDGAVQLLEATRPWTPEPTVIDAHELRVIYATAVISAVQHAPLVRAALGEAHASSYDDASRDLPVEYGAIVRATRPYFFTEPVT